MVCAITSLLDSHVFADKDVQQELVDNYLANRTVGNRDRVLEGYNRLIVSTADRFKGRGVALDDLVQEGWITLALALEKYDPTKLSFVSFATHVLRVRFLTMVGKEAKQSQRFQPNSNFGDGDSLSPIDTVEAREEGNPTALDPDRYPQTDAEVREFIRSHSRSDRDAEIFMQCKGVAGCGKREELSVAKSFRMSDRQVRRIIADVTDSIRREAIALEREVA